MRTVGIILALAGLVGCLLGVLGLVLTLLSPAVAHVSPDEMIPGFIGGGACCALSVLPLLLGVLLALIPSKPGRD